jgi:2-phosphosulfolactate phosphatase
MKIETILTPAELPALAQRDLHTTACVVFDVLRATSTFVTALHHGAKAIIPVSEIAEAVAIRKSQPGVLLGGERNGVKIRVAQKWDRHLACPEQAGSLSHNEIDFDLGNSPREYTPEKVRGKTIVSTTTNGTRALRACMNAQTVLATSFLNLTATAEFLRRERIETILLICAGTGENQADEDILAAGALCELSTRWEPSRCDDIGGRPQGPARRAVPTLSDATQVALRAWLTAKPDLSAAVCNSENARRLLAIPELRDDVAFCLQRDIFPLVAKMDVDGIIRVSV